MNRVEPSVWETLSNAGLVQPGEPPEIPLESPWYVKALLAISGWLAALFGFAFIGLAAGLLLESAVMSLVAGLVLVVVGVFTSRLNGNEFVENLGLIVSLVGQALFAWGLATDGFNNNLTVVLGALSVLYLVLMFVSGSFLHRVVFSIFLVCTSSALMFIDQLPVMNVNVFLLPIAWLWLNEMRWPRLASTIRSIAYGLTIGVVAVSAGAGWFQGFLGWLAPMGSQASYEAGFDGTAVYKIVAVSALLFVIVQCLRNNQRFGPNLTTALCLIGALVFAWPALYAPGVIAGAVILLCGFSASNRVLLGLGIVALLTFMSSYYYQLDTTLLTKSISLAAVGASLLVARAVLTLVPSR